MRQINQPPAHDAMDGWHRAVLDDLPQRLALMVVEKAGSARRLAVHKAIGTLGVAELSWKLGDGVKKAA